VSVRAITWAWEQPVRPPARKLVLVALADEADDTGACWPSQGRIAEKCGFGIRTADGRTRRGYVPGVRTVRAHLVALEAAGYLARSPRYRDQRRTSDLYQLALPAKFAGHRVNNGSSHGSARQPAAGSPRQTLPDPPANPAGSDFIGAYMRDRGHWE
jgi:hypothetical protein